MENTDKTLVCIVVAVLVFMWTGLSFEQWQKTERLRIEAGRSCPCAGDHSKCTCKKASE